MVCDILSDRVEEDLVSNYELAEAKLCWNTGR